MLRDRIILYLRTICFLLFSGFAWMGYNGDLPAPIIYGPLASFQKDVLILFAVACFLPLRFHYPLLITFSIASLNLAWISWTDWTSSGRGVGQFLGHAAQFFTPMLLCFVIRLNAKQGWTKGIDGFARRGLAFTLFSHGLFAYGYTSYIWILHHQPPSQLIKIVQIGLGTEELTTAAGFLRTMGIIDFVAAVCVLIPWTRIPALIYMVAWGFVAALTRTWVYFDPADAIDSLNRWVPEFLIRTPFFLLPLLLLWIWRKGIPAPTKKPSA